MNLNSVGRAAVVFAPPPDASEAPPREKRPPLAPSARGAGAGGSSPTL